MRSISPKKIREKLDERVVGQVQAKRVISSAVFMHYVKFMQSLYQNITPKKTNTLLMGPSGSGKTLLIREAASILREITQFDIAPVLEVDCTSLTGRGWVGDDLSDLLEVQYERLKVNEATFNSSIVFLDEIDKLCQPAISKDGTDFNRQTQYNLLKVVEGTKVQLPHSKKIIDTSKMMFVFAGNFAEIREKREKQAKVIKMGFDTSKKKKAKEPSIADLHKELDDIGLVTQLVGRITSVAELKPLTKKDLEDILLKHTIPEYLDTLDFMGYEINISPEERKKLVNRAWDREVGARGLQSVLEEYLFEYIEDMEFKQ